jgi:cell division cycle protein 37
VNKFAAEEEPRPDLKKQVELLNPQAVDKSDAVSSGAEADIEDGGAFDPEHTQPSTWGQKFAEIPFGDYDASQKMIAQHPSILTERESDALLILAFDKQLDGDEKFARQSVHQALLIQYCRQLGKDGVGLFFRRVTTKDHQARKLFLDDVNSTVAKIKERVKKFEKERAEEKGVEQIQLHAVDPSTTINIRVPPPLPTDLAAKSDSPPPTEDQILGRRIFESFSPGLRRALESGSLDEINKVLGKMSVDEAEDVVNKLSEGGILSVEEGILDATTEEGQHLMEAIQSGGLQNEESGVVELTEDPPLN